MGKAVRHEDSAAEALISMAGYAIWPGTKKTFRELERACANNCGCPTATIINPHPPRCAAHKMLTDQEALNRLAFVKTLAEAFEEAEWRGGSRR